MLTYTGDTCVIARAPNININNDDVSTHSRPWQDSTRALIGQDPNTVQHGNLGEINGGDSRSLFDSEFMDSLYEFQPLMDEIVYSAPWNRRGICSHDMDRPGEQLVAGAAHAQTQQQSAAHRNNNNTPRCTEAGAGIDFDRIRIACESNCFDTDIDMSPPAFAEHRKEHWPDMQGAATMGWDEIYTKVKATGLPNAKSARILLPTSLNIPAWEKYLDQSDDEIELLQYVKYGFPLGYMGPTSDTKGVPNHPSATNYKTSIDKFIAVELGHGSMIGPCDTPPFSPWMHISPIMTREKRETTDRRVIIDMTFPRASSVNAYIMKNTVCGEVRQHALPTVDNLVADIVNMGSHCYLSTADVSRAYKNFSSDPLSWPLLGMEWEGKFYCDTTMPFGARASSASMQRIATAIVRILRDDGVVAHMYLDDLVIVSPSRERAQKDYTRAKQLLQELGLPEAKDKAQPPAQLVRWLGIEVNTGDMTLSVPEDKLGQTLDQVDRVIKKRSITRKTLQSMLGRLLHIAKCVRPARLFVSKLLEALRGMKGFYINVNSEMRCDLRWFIEFGRAWNGVAMIHKKKVDIDIYVDACLTGVGGTDGRYAYFKRVCPDNDPVVCITELEAANVGIGLHTLISEEHRGSHIRVHCDNEGAVSVFSTGRGRNKVLLDCARKTWLIQARLDIKITYVHVPGVDNEVADKLSRTHMSFAHFKATHALVMKHKLLPTHPELQLLDQISPKIFCRSGSQLSANPGISAAAEGSGRGNTEKQQAGSQDLPGLRVASRRGPTHPSPQQCVYIPGVPVSTHTSTRHDKELLITGQSACISGNRGNVPNVTHEDHESHAGYQQKQGLCAKGEGGSTNGGTATHTHTDARMPYKERHQSSHADPVLRSPKTRRGHTDIKGKVQKYIPPHKRRSDIQGKEHSDHSQVRKDTTEDGGQEGDHTVTSRRHSVVCSKGM